MVTIPFLFRKLALAATGTLICAMTALAANAGAMAEAQARYRQDMAACNASHSNQDPAACRLEARNTLTEAKRGGLTTYAAEQYQQNALRRCEVNEGVDRAACEARMRGEGRVEGSVESGGILRESEVLVPAQ